jgi:hypothetical protein
VSGNQGDGISASGNSLVVQPDGGGELHGAAGTEAALLHEQRGSDNKPDVTSMMPVSQDEVLAELA